MQSSRYDVKHVVSFIRFVLVVSSSWCYSVGDCRSVESIASSWPISCSTSQNVLEINYGTPQSPGLVPRLLRKEERSNDPFCAWDVPHLIKGEGFRMFPSLDRIQKKPLNILDMIDKSSKFSYDRSSSPFFLYYDPSLPLTNHSIRGRPYERIISGSFSNFWSIIHDEEVAMDSTNTSARSFYVRYGGPLRTSLPGLLREAPEISRLVRDHIPRERKSAISLFIGSPGVVSTAHFDNHHNWYIVVSGTKEFLFARPRDAARFRIFPSAHPHARQGQTHYDDDPRSDLIVPTIRAIVRPGDLLFIPPGWIHHVRSGTSSLQLAISVTAQSLETLVFNRMVSGGRLVSESSRVGPLPFVPLLGGTWGFRRITSALEIFLGQIEDDLNATSAFEDLVRVAYSPSVRIDLGIPKSGREDRFPCVASSETVLSTQERDLVADTARDVSNWFLSTFSVSARRGHYLGAYLETVLGKLGGAPPMTAGLHFFEDCVLRKGTRRRSPRRSPEL